MKRNSDFKRRAKLRVAKSLTKSKLGWEKEFLRGLQTMGGLFIVFGYPIWRFQSTLVPLSIPLICGAVFGLGVAAFVLKKNSTFGLFSIPIVLKKSITFWLFSIPIVIAAGFLFCSLLFFINTVFADSKIVNIKVPITERYRLRRGSPRVFIQYEGISKTLNVTGTEKELFDGAHYVMLKAQKGALGYYIIKDEELTY